MKVTLPYPPSANRYWRTFRGRAVLSAEAKVYKKHVAALLAAAGHKPVSGPVAYTAHIYRPLRSGDLDNRLKVLGDALTGFAWLDDKQVVEIHAYRHDDKANPRVEVEVRALGVEGVLGPLTPAYQREQTEAVVSKARKFICRDCAWRGDDQDAANTHAKVKDHVVSRRKP